MVSLVGVFFHFKKIKLELVNNPKELS